MFNMFLNEERRVAYKKQLSPDLWEDGKIIERIKQKLIKIGKDFYEDLDVDTELLDIYFTGSMCNYNYSSDSDIDVHIIIDFEDVSDNMKLVKKAMDGQRFIWNLRHNIVIKGHDVELYVQDSGEKHTASSIYSLLYDKWIVEPKYNPPAVDQKFVDMKYDAKAYDIDELEKLSKDEDLVDPYECEVYYDKAKEMKAKIMKSRKEGLDLNGEFSIDNLVFKKLRKNGKIKKLIDTITRFYDKIYSQ